MKHVLVVCGTAIATSTLVATRIRETAEAEGLRVRVSQARIAEVPNYVNQVDLIVTSTPLPYDLKVPVFSAIPLLTGVGEEHALKAILDAIRKE